MSFTKVVECLYSTRRKKKQICCEICKQDFNLTLVMSPNTYICSDFCRKEFLAKFYNKIVCLHCSANILLQNNVYMGKDNTFCSKNCRMLFLRKIG